MKRIILFLILLLVLFSVTGTNCVKPTLNCEQACKSEGYKEGECKKSPVIQDPCSAHEEITLFDFECKQKPPKNIVGISYMCCCKE